MIKRVESKVDFIKIEHKILDFWSSNSIFDKRRKLNENNDHWSFIDGPITELRTIHGRRKMIELPG